MVKIESSADIGAKQDPLSQDELRRFNRAFERFLEDTRTLDTEVLVEKFTEYGQEILATAEVAKHELQGSFDGQSPSSNSFGMDTVHPGYFGYDDWDDMPTLTGGAANDWIDNDTPTNLAGGAGGFANPLGIGDPVVHVILGFGSYAADPVVSRIKWEKNEEPEAAVTTENNFRNSDLRIQWLDTPFVLQPQDDFAARVFAGGEAGTNYEDAVYPLGISFLEADAYRNLDPANMAGTSNANIVVEQ